MFAHTRPDETFLFSWMKKKQTKEKKSLKGPRAHSENCRQIFLDASSEVSQKSLIESTLNGRFVVAILCASLTHDAHASVMDWSSKMWIKLIRCLESSQSLFKSHIKWVSRSTREKFSTSTDYSLRTMMWSEVRRRLEKKTESDKVHVRQSCIGGKFSTLLHAHQPGR